MMNDEGGDKETNAKVFDMVEVGEGGKTIVGEVQRLGEDEAAMISNRSVAKRDQEEVSRRRKEEEV